MSIKPVVKIEKPLYQDPFSPVLTDSPSLEPSDEQKLYIHKLLEVSCSDSRFTQKAYDSILLILTGSISVPTLESINPNTAEIGSPSFILHVIGKNFIPNSKIVFAGHEEPTTVVSSKELTTGVNMAVWLGADTLKVNVITNGIPTNDLPFTFTSAAGIEGAFSVPNPNPVAGPFPVFHEPHVIPTPHPPIHVIKDDKEKVLGHTPAPKVESKTEKK